MLMPVDKLPFVIAQYFDTVVVPAAQSQGGLWAFGSSFIGGLLIKNANNLIQQYLPMSKQLGIVNADNMVNIDLLYEEATKAIQKGKPTILGYTLDQSDLDKLRDIMKTQGVQNGS